MRKNPPEEALVNIGLTAPVVLMAHAASIDPALANIRLIALTAHGLEKGREFTMDMGSQRHLVKPVDLADLTEMVGERVGV